MVSLLNRSKESFEVLPGDRFEIETELISWNRGIAKGKGYGKTDGEIACEADMLITIPEILERNNLDPKEVAALIHGPGAGGSERSLMTWTEGREDFVGEDLTLAKGY